MDRLNRVFSRTSNTDDLERLHEEARAFVDRGEADRMPLDEFERRFKITDIDHESQIEGYPNSEYYRPEDPEEIKRNRKALDDFLAAH